MTTSAVAISVRSVMSSPAAKYPRATATNGLTYAWLATRVAGMRPSSQTNAVKASKDPQTIRYRSAHAARQGIWGQGVHVPQ